jgi:hypothetical protein
MDARREADAQRLRAEKAESKLACMVHMLAAQAVGGSLPLGAVLSQWVSAGLPVEDWAYFQELAERWPVRPDLWTEVERRSGPAVPLPSDDGGASACAE